ncbi:RHS repeat-associated core domain-containing protein [Fimbriimonas ginsengisoli]|uniref:TonB-dependent receptor n=1 Tax=Fimbriimonas ginsengisoli Gsoil 348 TaxID=661478 RepID=A0A068NTL0_FIMGI|nr:RHS repeat-associated core domain-containing protein [Fimbriimonas ginsengisoli]AIE86065.1 TonB-dependent receptor [Fimbriimonas ginsengisoli Gsoil 348]
MTFPNWMEGVAPIDQSSAPEGGPASSIAVNLAYGAVDIDSGPDFTLDNPTGPVLTFERRYRTPLAVARLSSPGLPAGWTHNWDYRILQSDLNSWSPLTVVYPNGGSENLTPVLNNGVPTGAFSGPVGVPYVATGAPASDGSHTWTSITLQHNGLAKEVFAKLANDSTYRLSTSFSANGGKLVFVYSTDPQAKLTQINNGMPAGPSLMKLTLTYAATGGMLSRITNSVTTSKRNYTHTNGLLTKMSKIDSSSAEWTYAYTTMANGSSFLNVVGTSDPQGAMAYANVYYDSQTGRATSVTDALSNARSFTYDDHGGASASASPQSGSAFTSYGVTFGSDGRLVGEQSAAGDVVTYDYSASNPSMIAHVYRQVGAAISVDIDTHGNPTKVTYPLGNYVQYGWSYPSNAPLGQLNSISRVGYNGTQLAATTFSYYGATESGGKSGLLKSMLTPTGGLYTYSYTSLGSVQSINTPSISLSYDYAHDHNGTVVGTERYEKPYSIEDSGGRFADYAYDTSGRVTTSADAAGNQSSFVYNKYDQLTSATSPLQQQLTIGYTIPGKGPTSQTVSSPTLGQLSVGAQTYNKESGLATLTDGNNLASSATYTPEHGIGTLTNAAAKPMHSFSLNAAARSASTIFGSGSKSLTRSVTYNANGNVTSTTGSDNRSATVTRSQIAPDLVSSIRWTDEFNSAVEMDFGHDEFGRVSQATSYAYGEDPSSSSGFTHQFSYDDEDRLLDKTIPGRTTAETSYVYNADGSRQTMFVGFNSGTSNGGYYAAYQYGYDDSRRVASITVNYANISKQIFGAPIAVVRYAYDASGNVKEMRTPKSDTFYTFNAIGQLTSLYNVTPDGAPDPNAPAAAQFIDPADGSMHTVLSGFSGMTYDLLGNRLGMDYYAMATYGSGTPTFISGSVAWTYDSGGRLTAETWSGGPSYTHSYDAAGNLTTLRGISWSADSLSDQLTGSSGTTGYAAPQFNASGEMTSARVVCAYDPAGAVRSVGGSSPFKSGETFWYVPKYDEAGQRRWMQVGTYWQGIQNIRTETYAYDGSRLVMRANAASDSLNNPSDLSTDPTVLYVWGPTGAAMEFNPSGISKSFTFDPQGNCVATSAGRTDKPMLFDAYGQPIFSYTNDMRSLQQPFQYKGEAGYYTDAYSKLNYCLSRYYDPLCGRWTSRDTLGLAGGENVYQYCNANPVMNIDPTGQVIIRVISYRVFNGGWHRGIVVIDNVGHNQAWSFAGGPEKGGMAHVGNLVSRSGPWKAGAKTQDYGKWHYQEDALWYKPMGLGTYSQIPEDERRCITLVHNKDAWKPWIDKFQAIEAKIKGQKPQDYAPLPSEFHLWGGKTANSNTWCHYLLQEANLLDQYNHAIKKLPGEDLPWAPGWFVKVPYNDAP